MMHGTYDIQTMNEYRKRLVRLTRNSIYGKFRNPDSKLRS